MSNQRRPDLDERPTDAALMVCVRGGSLAELGALFERYAPRVHALCYRLTGDADAADDLTQETFLRVRAGADAFRGDARFSTWLYRLAYNATVDHIRRVKSGQQAIDRMRRDLEIVRTADASPEQSERGTIVEAALGALSQDDRDVLVLTRYHNLRYDEVAEIVGCTAATARVRAHRAIQQLRQLCLEMERRDYDLRPGSPRDRRSANGEPR
jgi:RNA polymerase sigma factor (sigma-70 family)